MFAHILDHPIATTAPRSRISIDVQASVAFLNTARLVRREVRIRERTIVEMLSAKPPRHHLVGKQLQRPVRASFGCVAARDGYQTCFISVVQLTLLSRSRALIECAVEFLLHKPRIRPTVEALVTRPLAMSRSVKPSSDFSSASARLTLRAEVSPRLAIGHPSGLASPIMILGLAPLDQPRTATGVLQSQAGLECKARPLAGVCAPLTPVLSTITLARSQA